jgi:signal transduction histidine kinase
MVMRRILPVIVLLTIPVIGLVGCGSSNTQTSQQPVPPTKEEVVSFVNKALEYAKVNGKEKALAEFTDQNGEFAQGELYIYAYDYSGTVLAHGGNPSLVGQNLYNMEDANGVKVIQELINLARQGGGWLSYLWDNPTTQKNEPKLGYAVAVDDTWWLGSGTYPQS